MKTIIEGIIFFDDCTMPDGGAILSVKLQPCSSERKEELQRILEIDAESFSIELIEEDLGCYNYHYAELMIGGTKVVIKKKQKRKLREFIRNNVLELDWLKNELFPDITKGDICLIRFLNNW